MAAQTKNYLKAIYSRCPHIPETELQDMANEIDPYIGSLLYYSFINQASYESVEDKAMREGTIVPICRNSFYIKRRKYINHIMQRLAAAG